MAALGSSTSSVILASRDFGGLVEHSPREVIRVRSTEDVVNAIVRARRERLTIAARGQGHCTRGQALAPGGLVLAMQELDQIEIDGDTAIVGAGARWDAVVRATWAHGLTPPTLTDYLGLSVGGTLAVGGVGGSSFRSGTQTDQVLELTVVTGRGEVHKCSADREPALFDACRAGLGQVAIIVEAKLQLVPAPLDVAVYRFPYDELSLFLGDLQRLVDDGRFASVRGSIVRDGKTPSYVIEAHDEHKSPADYLVRGLRFRRARFERTEHSYLEFVERLFAMEHEAHANGTWEGAHPWFDLFVPGSRASKVIEYALSELEGVGMTSGHLMVFPLCARKCNTPLLPVLGDPYAFLFDVLPDVRRGDQAAILRWNAYAERVLARAWPLGARPYPIGFPVGTAHARWPEHFGEAWPAFAAARARHDPDGILTPGPAIFPTLTSERLRSCTLGQLATIQLTALGHAAGEPELARALAELVPIVSGGWDSVALTEAPAWPSDLTDDGTPFELSIGLTGAEPDLGLLVEPRQVSRDSRESFAEALKVGHALRDRHGANLDRLERVLDLFEPPVGSMPRFTLWYAVQYRVRGPLFKAYLNPELRGPNSGPDLVREALTRVGMASAWSFIAERCVSSTTMPYVSLDLSIDAHARVKVYVAHHAATAAQLEHAGAGTCNHRAGDFARWLPALAPGRSGGDRPVLVCYALVAGQHAPEVTLHVPVRCHVVSDRVALRGARSLCAPRDGRLLERVVTALATRPLDAGRGLITYVSLRRILERVRVTAYLAPQPFAVTATRPPSPRMKVRDLFKMIEAARGPYAAHPFFARLEQGIAIEDARRVAQRLSVFAMTFQDMLRHARERCTDVGLATVLHQHELEDHGHDAWFLADLEVLGLSRDLGRAFAEDQAAIRDASYDIIGALRGAHHDVTRVAVVLALEAAGKEFFGRFDPAFRDSGLGEHLRYFGRSHEEVEASHHLTSAEDGIFEHPLVDDALPEAAAAVAMTFDAMTRIAEAMAGTLATSE